AAAEPGASISSCRRGGRRLEIAGGGRHGPVEHASAALRDLCEQRVMRCELVCGREHHRQLETAAVDPCLAALPAELDDLLSSIERQADLPAGHRQIDVG